MQKSDIWQFLSLVGERYLSSATRGVIIFGSLYLAFWTFKRPWMEKFRVPTVGSQKAKPLREAFFTFATYAVYASAGALVVMIARKTGYLVMYTDVHKYGWLYTIGSFFIFLFYTDT